jgi:hypothetical protein
MRVLVDTSVWVDFFNGHPSRQAATLAHFDPDEAHDVSRARASAPYRIARDIARLFCNCNVTLDGGVTSTSARAAWISGAPSKTDGSQLASSAASAEMPRLRVHL